MSFSIPPKMYSALSYTTLLCPKRQIDGAVMDLMTLDKGGVESDVASATFKWHHCSDSRSSANRYELVSSSTTVTLEVVAAFESASEAAFDDEEDDDEEEEVEEVELDCSSDESCVVLSGAGWYCANESCDDEDAEDDVSWLASAAVVVVVELVDEVEVEGADEDDEDDDDDDDDEDVDDEDVEVEVELVLVSTIR